MVSEEEIAEGFNDGFDCAMAVFSRLAPKVGLTEDQGKKLASCFGVGMMQGAVCGAVSGALIAIGYKYGNTEPKDISQRGLCLQKRQEFIDKFVEEFKNITCPGLLGLDLRKEDDMEKAHKQGILSKICPKYCRRAIEITEGIIG
ncbi:MAG: C-GCAxxG-C-C family protein [archaeon]|nr:C-GCAxxG-C-C family protein [archaeon]